MRGLPRVWHDFPPLQWASVPDGWFGEGRRGLIPDSSTDAGNVKQTRR